MRSPIGALCAILAVADGVDAGSISLATDPSGGGLCRLNAPAGGAAVTLYVLAQLGGGVNEMTGAEFAVTGLPEGLYNRTVSANPAATIAIGDPLGNGCNIVFSTCQVGTVLLYTVTLQNISDAESRTLRVEAHRLPGDPNFACPLVTLCDGPDFSKQCVLGVPLYLNPPPAQPPHDPSPPDGALDVPLHPLLTFVYSVLPFCDTHSAQELVYFGTDPDPPLVATSFDFTCGGPCYDPGELAPQTTYYWRVRQTDAGSSPVWSFTTRKAVAVEPAAWGRLKALFR